MCPTRLGGVATRRFTRRGLWFGLATTALVLSRQHAAWATEVPFGSPPAISTTADGAISVFAADVDGDGDMDVLSASQLDAKILWYENDASPPTWPPHTISTAADGAISVFAADVDGDGDIDALSASLVADTIVWYENNGASPPVWTARTIDTSANIPHSIFAADVDGDGDTDVLRASESGPKIAWYENNGASPPAWTRRSISANPNGAISVFAADLDGDKDMDVLSASINDDKIAWYENDGTPAAGGWSQHVISIAADGAHSVFAADVDGDGDTDVLSASQFDSKIAWYENAGTFPPVWTARTISTAATNAQSVFTADVDGDGDIDVLSASFNDDKIAWYENNGASPPTWTARTISIAADGAVSVFASDVDGDGDTDVLSASQSDDRIAWYENKTIHRSAVFPETHAIASTAYPASARSVFAADVDGDGDTDLLSALSLSNKIAWHENDGTPGDPGDWTLREITSTASDARSVFGADVDGDGDIDALSASEADDEIAWYENDGAAVPGWTARTISTTANGAQSVFAADLDGDGDTDVLSASNFDDKIAWYENDGTPGGLGDWTEHSITTNADGAVAVYAADVDGDGDTDVLSASSIGFVAPLTNMIAWYENLDGQGAFSLERVISNQAEGAWSVSAADVDGDGDTDALSASIVDNTLAWYENDGTPGGLGDWTAHTIYFGLPWPYTAFPADFDGDGDVDVLTAFLNHNRLEWFENDGASLPGWTTHTITTSPAGPLGVSAADLDQDGDLDAISSSLYDFKITWYENQGGQFALPTLSAAPAAVQNDAVAPLVAITATHNGRAGDTAVELATLELLLEEAPADPLTSAEANGFIDELRVYLDDGSGRLETGTDTLVATVGTLSLAAGVQTVTLADGDPAVQIAHGTPRTYFVAAEIAADTTASPVLTFRVTHETSSSSTAQDAAADIPLSLEFTPMVFGPSILIGPPYVTLVVPQDNALDGPVGTNVTVVFSEPVNPATVTTSTFRVLDPGGTPVTASVGLAPDGKTATLDPFAALSFGTVYTVDVTSGVTDLAGTPAVPFTSRFNTVSAVAGIPLPTVSDQSVLPSPPPFLPPGMAPKAPTTVGANLGYSVASAGDLNKDGLGDFVGGAPGYAPGARTEAGGVAVYLGSNAPEPSSGNHPREVAEIIFTGSAAHDRAGSSVAGGFDFDGDGIEDFLIGAEQVDRTQLPAVETGPGKVYLILFKPLQYDRSPVDGVPDYLVNPGMFVPLGEVGTTISGVVFSGTTLGDQAGYAVAGGGHLESGDSRDDIVIGAPGASGDNGKVYVVFSNPALSGAKALSDVGGSIAGVVYQGSLAERLGSSLALPGDVTSPVGPDIAMGAPDADTILVDAGKVYVAPAGSLTPGTINVSSIVTQVHGDQACEHLGFAVAGGGDNRADTNPTLPGGDFDLLIGAPDYDPNTSTGDPCLGTTPMPDAGRVVQTSGRLPANAIQASQVGSTLPGIIWRGTQAGGHLGWSMARLGDMSGNNLEDIGLGAPDANPGMSNAGAVYVIEGSANVGLLGTVDASLVGQTVSGGIFLGTQASERAGLVLAGVGDLDGDTTSAPNDFTVGSPGWDDNAGTVHQVLGSILQQPGQCTALGCTVADLSTGALLEVAPNALATQARFQVRGLVTPAPSACSATSLAGKTLVGTSDDTRIDCGAPPCSPPGFAVRPNIEVPARAEVDYQLVNGEALELRYCDATLGWRPLSAPVPPTGTVKANTFLPAPRKSVRALGVDTLHLFGVFFPDGDQDGARLSCDCNDTDATLWDRPLLVETLLLSQNRITGVTTLTWTPPAFPGGTAALRYDTVRSTSRSNFVAGASCVEGDGTDVTSTDATNPATGQVFYYIVVPQNNCPSHATCLIPDPRTPALECTGS